MPDDIQIEIVTPDQVFGSTTFTLSVRITNVASEELSALSVEPITVPGRVVQIGDDEEDTAMTELQMAKRRLVREMEDQVQRAYERNRLGNMSTGQKVASVILQILEVYTSIFTLGRSKSNGLVPTWATESLKIEGWDDVERLEKDFIVAEDESSFLRKAFSINKDKLKRCIVQMNDADGRSQAADSLGVRDSLMPSGSASYPFSIRAPHALRSKPSDLQFRITYKKGSQQKVFQRSVGKAMIVLSSAFAVPTGSMIGAACGYMIRYSLKLQTSTLEFSWPQLGGSVLLGLVLALLTSRKPEAKKPITVEDFVGGFLIGTAAGLFSHEALKRLAVLFQ